ncbi:hypothetical protein HQ584_02250 [Patescibacteria group bacterium]|nr:hypothetical protein [Patescibacteria group bacterium]
MTEKDPRINLDHNRNFLGSRTQCLQNVIQIRETTFHEKVNLIGTPERLEMNQTYLAIESETFNALVTAVSKERRFSMTPSATSMESVQDNRALKKHNPLEHCLSPRLESPKFGT